MILPTHTHTSAQTVKHHGKPWRALRTCVNPLRVLLTLRLLLGAGFGAGGGFAVAHGGSIDGRAGVRFRAGLGTASRGGHRADRRAPDRAYRLCNTQQHTRRRRRRHRHRLRG